jgi:hypothetical protein
MTVKRGVLHMKRLKCRALGWVVIRPMVKEVVTQGSKYPGRGLRYSKLHVLEREGSFCPSGSE